MKSLVVGASGFVGQHLLSRLQADGLAFRGAYRNVDAAPDGFEAVQGHLDPNFDWTTALKGCDSVVHLAGRVHVMQETTADPLANYRRVNVEGTLKLAADAVSMGVRRFVFLSSVKVNGESSRPDAPFSASDEPSPCDPYGQSKLEAEIGLRALAANSALEVVVLRPPLIYGPGVRANFLTMLKLLDKCTPLPFGLVDNQRSLVGVDNLTDLILCCLHHPAAANQTFMASDGDDLSTPQMLRGLAVALGRKALIMHVPVSLLEFGARVTGKQDVWRRLSASLQVDLNPTRQILGWAPSISVYEGFERTAVWFRQRSKTD